MRTLIGRATLGIVAALDASARTVGFDPVLVAQTDAAQGISLSAGISASVVSVSFIIRVQSAELPAVAKSEVGISHRGGVEQIGEEKSR